MFSCMLLTQHLVSMDLASTMVSLNSSGIRWLFVGCLTVGVVGGPEGQEEEK